MNPILIFLLISSFLASSVFSKWTGPYIIHQFEKTLSHLAVSGVFRDPSTHINHVLYECDDTNEYWYAAVDDDGKLLRQTNFKSLDNAFNGIIRGSGDGQHLYIAMYSKTGSNFNTIFTESSDNGATWKQPIVVFKEDGHDKKLHDMIYIADTGRLIIFSSDMKTFDMLMTTRPAGSTLFTPETVIAHSVNVYVNSKATYNTWLGRTIIHLLYVEQRSYYVYYIRSLNMGIEWSEPKLIASESVERINAFVANSAITDSFYAIYTMHMAQPAKLIVSDTFGSTFSITTATKGNAHTGSTNDGLALCGVNKIPILTSFITMNLESDMPEYAAWDTINLKPVLREHPFTEPSFYSGRLDCEIDRNKSLLNVPIFTVRKHDGKTSLMFALESYPVPI